MELKQMAYLPLWAYKNIILDRKNPLQTVLFITDYCNLKCRHCFEMGHACTMQKTFSKIKEELEYAYGLGSRFVDLEGGEPTLWKENGRNINDIIRLAKKIGFFSVTVTTNAQLPIDWVEADLIWVSLDGIGKYHDEIRGDGAFARLEKNVKPFASVRSDRTDAMEESGQEKNSITAQKGRHRRKLSRLGANIAVNRYNKDAVVKTVKYVKQNPAFESIAVNFHTPYPGTEDLCLSMKERAEVIDKVIAMKKAGYPIQNSISGLEIMKKRGFRKYCWISNFITTDGTRYKECPGRTLGICDDCGFCMAGEMYSIMHLKPDTMLAGARLRL